jgi:Domain of Unknown Function (DUF1080)
MTTRDGLCFLMLSGLLSALSPGTGRIQAAMAEPADDSGYVTLFDGKSLDGWKKVGGGATYAIEGDNIVGRVGPGSNTFLRTEKLYGDFILKLDLKLDIPGNSGLQFRSHQKPSADGNGRVFGYQCEVEPTSHAIDPKARSWSGGVYDEGRRGWLFPLTGHPEAQKAFKVDGWNQYTIMACGPHIRTWLNGVACADLIDTMDLEGFIALQVHTGKAGQIRWKNLRIKDLGQSTWKPLWDGKTLAGWNAVGGGGWKIEDGVIHGKSSAGESRHGLLITDSTAVDFAVRLKFKDHKGNSGLYIRCEEGGNAGVLGLQAEISDMPEEVGGLYETGGRGWVARAKPKEVPATKAATKKAAPPKPEEPSDGWNELAVVALGDRIVIQVNGRTTAEVRDDPGRKSGRIALQLHGGQDMDVEFKDVEILSLDTKKCPD